MNAAPAANHTINDPVDAVYRLEIVSLLAALIGILAGLVAYALYDLIGLFTNLAYYHEWSFHFRSPEHTQIGPWIIVTPVVGALIIGFMAKYGSEKIKGHGIPEAMEAVFTTRSPTEAKVAILKPLSPPTPPGPGAPFNPPPPRVNPAIDLRLFEVRPCSFIPLVIACTLATSIRAILLGQRSMFSMGNVNFDVLHGLPFYLILGVLSGLAAIVFTKVLYWVEDLFEHLPIDDLWHPAIGALGLGIIGFFVPRVLGVGYDTISDILNNNLALKLLLIVAICKALAMVISLGSGSSGGLLAPMFMSSAALGGAFAMVMNLIFPSLHLSPGAYALVAMAAVFGSASRATLAFIVFAFEITRDYNAILPLMLGCVVADMIALRYLPNSIMTEKLARRGLRVPDQFEVSAMKISRVAEVMRQDVRAITETMRVGERP